MNLDEYLRLEVSKAHTRRIAGMVQQKPELLHHLWDIAMSDKEPVNWRAAWVIKGIWEEKPGMVEPLLGKIRKALPGLKKEGVKREFLRILTEYPLPEDEDELGFMLKACFDWLADPIEPIAVKVHSMTILLEICKQIPEIIPEFRTTLELAMAEGSAGIVNRGSKILKALYKFQISCKTS